MPISIVPSAPVTVLRELEMLLHTLSIYGAFGITAFGWAMGQLFNWEVGPWMPYWFCAALLVYNADRLRHDPADALNIPVREAAAARLRVLSFIVLILSALVLLVLPIVQRDWLTLALVLGGALVSLNYSIPLFGFRFKDVPLLKTFFAPTIVTASVLGLPWLHLGSGSTDLATLAIGSLRSWAFLMFNMILCDLRDRGGDEACGIRSLPVVLGDKGTRWLLVALLACLEALALGALALASDAHRHIWAIMCIVGPIYLGGILLAVRRPRPERFYEWVVEGMLFLPAVAVVVAG
ncbi:MAG: UbiA family prenyltransferase [Chthoniobacter sp.]|uniref:UbiA family prenyltransferase n=1 Tax=Chthoniobacter sp. TaxID=2510640 RepID=UPI0032A71B3D